MKVRHWITALVLLLLVAAAIVGMVRTQQRRGASEDVAAAPGTQAAPTSSAWRQHAWVDQRPLQTARQVGTLAYTQEEKDLAQQAEKVADHEVDLAFFDAFRAAQDNPPATHSRAQEVVRQEGSGAAVAKGRPG